ncbi:MAG: hypothetical protein R2864_08815 [Syntrophotaleaceae bacterium]
MDQGLIHPMSMLKDAPHRYGGFAPENYDKAFLGPMLARDALIASRNVPAAALQARLGKPGLYQLLQSAGVEELREESYRPGSVPGRGGADHARSAQALRHARQRRPAAGAAVAGGCTDGGGGGGGRAPEPRGLFPGPRYSQAQSPAGAAAAPRPERRRPAGGLEDRYLPRLSRRAGRWAFPDPTWWRCGSATSTAPATAPLPAGRPPGPLLFDIFHSLSRGKPWQATGRLKPGLLNLAKVAMCADSGDLPGRYCPRTAESWFIPGISPIKVSTVHRAVPVDRQTGLRACRPQPGRTELRVFEYWPSDLQRIFRQAGLALKTPPPFEADCDLDTQSGSGAPPQIQSPTAHIEYRLRSENLDTERIPFSAVADGDVQQLFWFVDDRYVGSSRAAETFVWSPASGDFTVRVVDDHGRADRRALRVGMVRDREG